MGGDLNDLIADLKRINEEGQALGLILNVSKSKQISHDQSKLGTMFSTFQDLYSFCGSKNCHPVGLSPRFQFHD